MHADCKATTSLIGPKILLLLLLLNWAGGPLAFAADEITVDSADPSTAEQGTINLDVTIKGNGFGTGSQVDFFQTGTTNPAGIVVKNVRRKGPKQLIANIDVDAEASVGDFDIQVRSNGRTGKGTELFKVTEKTTGGGNDTIPPGVVYDLAAGLPGYTNIPVTWTETADDGYDVSSGPARHYSFKFSLDGPLTDANWDDYGQIHNGGAWGEGPGAPQGLDLGNLVPGATHNIAVRVTDFADNNSFVSNVAVATTMPLPVNSWSVEEVATCPVGGSGWVSFAGFDYDSSGTLTVAYDDGCTGQQGTKLARWDGADFITEVIDIDIDIDGNGDFAFDPTTGEATAVGFDKGKLSFFRRVGSTWISQLINRSRTRQPSLAYSDGNGLPAVAYQISSRKGEDSCGFARFNGTAWVKEVVDPSTSCANPHLAFDPAGKPAMVYLDDLLSEPSFDANDTLKFAYWDGAGWIVESVDQTPGRIAFSPTVAYDPARGDFSAAYESTRKRVWPDGRINHGPGEVRFCERTAGNWICGVVDEADYVDVKGSWLTYDDDDTAYLAYAPLATLTVASRAAGATQWVKEHIDWGTTSASIMVGPDGSLIVANERYTESPKQKSLYFAWRPIP